MGNVFGRWPPLPWSPTGRARAVASDNPIAPVLELNPRAWFRADRVTLASENVLDMVGLVGTEGRLTVTDGEAYLGASFDNNNRPQVELAGFLISTMAPAFWDFMLTGEWSLFAVYTPGPDAVDVVTTTASDWALRSDIPATVLRFQVGNEGQYFEAVNGGSEYPDFLDELVSFQAVSSYPGQPSGSNVVFDCQPFPLGSPVVGNGGEYQDTLPLASLGTLRCGSDEGPTLRLSELIFFDRAVTLDAEITTITGYLVNRYRAPDAP